MLLGPAMNCSKNANLSTNSCADELPCRTPSPTKDGSVAVSTSSLPQFDLQSSREEKLAALRQARSKAKQADEEGINEALQALDDVLLAELP